ncbi:MAG: GGDEF domain-containing protein [Pedobacter sp.]
MKQVVNKKSSILKKKTGITHKINSHELYSAFELLNLFGYYISVFDSDGNFIKANSLFLNLFDSYEKEYEVPNLIKLLRGFKKVDIKDKIFNEPEKTKTIIVRKSNGTTTYINVKLVAVKHTETENGYNIVAAGMDFTKQTMSLKSLKRLSITDPITGLYNRSFLIDKLKDIIAFNKYNKKNYYVALIDLDRFKLINDKYGHSVGDSVLKFFAEKLKESLRANDIVCRLGGDEFFIILPNISCESKIPVIAQRIVNNLNFVYLISGEKVNCSASIGITKVIEKLDTPEELITEADKRMYLSKKSGGNSFNFS